MTSSTLNAVRPDSPTLNTGRTLRLALFQIGSAIADILVTSVWNRIMIKELGMNATPVGFLIALRYLLAPLAVWAGFWSDTRPIFGLHRTPYIWLGRGLMAASYPLLALSLNRFYLDRADALGWGMAVICFLMYGTGSLLSGSPFLSLVRDLAPANRRGLALGIMETALLVAFALVGISFSLLVKTYDPVHFWQVTLGAMGVSGLCWFIAIVGIERREETSARSAKAAVFNFSQTFGKVWHDPATRHFFIFLALATLAAWMQDAILEPFGGEVLGQTLSQTTRYSSYWQTATVLTLILTGFLLRRRAPEQLTRVTQVGLGIMAVGMAAMAFSAFGAQVRVLQLALVVYGAGFGIYTYGGFSLMAAMTSDTETGTYLGLWTICVLLSRGLGIFFGSLGRDLGHWLAPSPAISYGLVFLLSAIGLAASVFLLARVDVPGFARRVGRVEPVDTSLTAGI